MELMTLDSNFQPAELIENYESLIWTERYSQAGDFELQSSDISTLINLVPIENPSTGKATYVTLRESTVPMIVETHKITKGPRSSPMLVVTGRSFDSVLERRASVNNKLRDEASGVNTEYVYPGSTRPEWWISATKESDAAYKVMRIVLGDEPRYQDAVMVLPITPPAASTLDVIPEIDLVLPKDYSPNPPAWNATTQYKVDDLVYHGTDIYQALISNINITPPGTGIAWVKLAFEIEPKDLYSTVLDLINTNHRGIKAVRPIPGEYKVGIEIYNGANLTGVGPGSDSTIQVVLDVRFDQVEDSTYLLSMQGSTNVAYFYGKTKAGIVLKTAAPEPAGLMRRVLQIDQTGDDTTNPAAPATAADVRRSRSLIELYKYNATALFDGQVAQQIAQRYNKGPEEGGYYLGDIIKLVGDYSLSENVRVAEFIRTSDATGEKAYPAFEAVPME